jgi:hypothetical protein
MICDSQLESIIASLRPDTRAKVMEEVKVAMADTQKEYSQQPCNRKDVALQHDVWAFHAFLEVCKRITGEYDEIQSR